jgi:hypothetical protein
LILFYFETIFLIIFNSAIEEQNKDQQPDLVRNSSPFHHEPTSSVPGMDDAEFRRRGKEMIDYIADYLKNIK